MGVQPAEHARPVFYSFANRFGHVEHPALRAFRCFELTFASELRLVDLTADGLSRLGLDAQVTTIDDYSMSRRVARELFEHAERPDGILYRSRHDPSLQLAAVFARSGRPEPVFEDRGLAASHARLGAILDRYGVALI